MSNIPLKCLIGAFAVVSITGCDATADRDAPPTGWNARKKADKVDVANKGFCQKSQNGYEICIKKENVSCKSSSFTSDVGVSTRQRCGAGGISTDLTGKAKHWTTAQETYNEEGTTLCHSCFNEDCYSNSTFKFTCNAARHFRKSP